MPNPPRPTALVLRPAGFQEPREVEHPLASIRDVATPTLFWVQPRLMLPAYELWAGEEVVATLRYRGRFGGEGLAASAEGVWRLAADASGGVRVWIYDADGLAGTLEPETAPRAPGRYRLRLSDGAAYAWRAERGDAWTVTDALGAGVLGLQSAHDPRPGLRVERMVEVWHPTHVFLALVGKHLNLTVARTVCAREPLYLPGRSSSKDGGGRLEA